MKIAIGDVPCEVVTESEAQTETVEALRRKHCQVRRPKFTVVEPGLVLDIALEAATDGADGVGRPLDHILGGIQSVCERRRAVKPIGQLEQRVDQPTHVGAAGEQYRVMNEFAADECKSFWASGKREFGLVKEFPCRNRRPAGSQNAKVPTARGFHAQSPLYRKTPLRKCLLQFSPGPHRGRGGSNRISGICNNGEGGLLSLIKKIRETITARQRRTPEELAPAKGS